MKNLSRFCDLKGKFSPKDTFVLRLLQDIGTESKTSNTYLFKVKYRNTIERGKMCSKLTRKTPERRHDVVLVPFTLTLDVFHSEQVNVSWAGYKAFSSHFVIPEECYGDLLENATTFSRPCKMVQKDFGL